MNSIFYDLFKLSISSLLRTISDAGSLTLAAEFAAIDAGAGRSEAAIDAAKAPGRAGGWEKVPFIYDFDWDEGERLGE